MTQLKLALILLVAGSPAVAHADRHLHIHSWDVAAVLIVTVGLALVAQIVKKR
ncbi:hypothetical protein ACP2AV_12890 [Aliiroseovarius sp. PTFE2010]|uniref:hypothetical protein n=1 Tax=Aliiroseovarius sp. PTFE2010 TaxID=3417190 RepID=UPI003CF5E437